MKIALEPVSVLIVVFSILSIASAQTDKSIESEKTIRHIASDIQKSERQIEGSNPTNAHNLSNQSYNVRVVLDHIFISKENSSLKISESVVFRNEGPEIYYGKDNHTFFAISTPPEAKNLKTQVMECCLVQEEGVVLMDPMQPVNPGDNFEMQVSYTLLPQGGGYVFNKSAVYNTTSLLLFVDKKSGVNLEGLYETTTLQGNEYDVIAFSGIRAGETISTPIKTTQEQNYLYAAIGLISLFSIGLVYHFKDKIFKKVKKEYTLEELEFEKKTIFQAIYGFEKHTGAESSEEYRRLMDEYRQKAIQMFIKIDEIKNKNQLKRMEKTQT